LGEKLKSGGIRAHSKRFADFGCGIGVAERLECARIPPLCVDVHGPRTLQWHVARAVVHRFAPALGCAAIALLLTVSTSSAQSVPHSLAQRRWIEARTAHFHTYSCGQTQEVARLTARLEQFREAYSALAGNESVASPPIVVMAFPDHASMKSFVPLYQGKPATIEAFFMRGSDENLIVLPLAGMASMEVIFHEYTHLLMRHNQAFWPIWLNEGMAEIYGTFEVTGQHSARIGLPLAHHLRLLARESLMPLKQLLEVTHESPEYNERDRQRIFYAQSWLLTHYLMLGNNGSRRAGLGQFTALLRQGKTSEQAFTTAFHTTLTAMNNELRGYLAREKFQPLALNVNADLLAPRQISTRALPPVEVWFRLGDELMRVHRFETAEACFLEAQKLNPTSPLPCEGLGLLAAERDHSDEAIRWLGEALHRGSESFLAHYEYAHEKFEASATQPGWHARLPADKGADIRAELHKALELMPDFGPAHHLLGLFEFIQHDDLAGAVQHLQRAIQLEPENQGYLISLAQAQFEKDGAEAARRTLEPLRLPYVEPEIRARAQELLKEMGK
jgi:tetratricopeptide (TPR) repeat protein